MFPFLKKNNSGFSMLEIMVAAGMLGVLSLAVTQLMTNQTRAVKSTESRFDEIKVINHISATLADKSTCRANFGVTGATPPYTGNHNMTVDELTTIDDRDGNTLYTANINPLLAPNATPSGLKITRMILQHPVPAAPGDYPALGGGAPASGRMYLAVSFFRGNNQDSSSDITRFIPIFIDSNNNNDRVSNCNASSNQDTTEQMAEYICNTLGGNFDPNGLGGLGECNQLGQAMAAVPKALSFETNLEIADSFTINLLSDINLKHEVSPLSSEQSLQAIRNIQPSSFRWNKSNKKDFGFIAQNVQAADDMLVSDSGEFLSVKLPQLLALTINSAKEIDHQTNNLKRENQKLKEKVNLMQSELCQKFTTLSFCN